MIRFPETAQVEWETVADAAEAEHNLRRRIQRATEVEKETERLRVRHEAALMFQQELDADGTPALEMTNLSAYKNNPALAPTDLIEGAVKDNGLCIVLGPSGSGKSTDALQMIHSFSTGDDWLGQPATQLSGGFGILSYDMDGTLVADWMNGYPGVDPDRVSIVNAYRRGNPLAVPAMRSQIVAAWKAMSVEVVVLDSFSASFFGDNQNDAAHVMAHYRDMRQFALTEVGARVLVVIVHSTAASPDKARGSTVHEDVADTIIGVSGTGLEERHVKMLKYRAGRGQVQMSPVVLGKPDSVTHLVDLDIGAMTLAGYQTPAGTSAFTAMPDTHDDPDTESDSDDEGDDL